MYRHPRSRWQRGVTTFEPGIKLAITAAVLVFLLAFYSMAWIIVVVLIPGAIVFIWSVWQRDEVDKAPTLDLRQLGRSRRETHASDDAAGSPIVP